MLLNCRGDSRSTVLVFFSYLFWAAAFILNKQTKRNQSYSDIKTLAKGETQRDPVERGRSLLDFGDALFAPSSKRDSFGYDFNTAAKRSVHACLLSSLTSWRAAQEYWGLIRRGGSTSPCNASSSDLKSTIRHFLCFPARPHHELKLVDKFWTRPSCFSAFLLSLFHVL